MNLTSVPITTELKWIGGRKIYSTRNGSTIRWTTPERAARQVERSRRTLRARDFNQRVRDLSWIGHLDEVGIFRSDCGCPACTGRRFNKW